MRVKIFGIESKFKRGFEKGNMRAIIIIELTTIVSFYLLIYLQFSVIKWAKQRRGYVRCIKYIWVCPDTDVMLYTLVKLSYFDNVIFEMW